MAEDYYKILEVDRSATAEAIKKSYLKLAARHHPDMNPDDRKAKEKFQRIQKAYDVLKDPEKRKLYDQFGENFEAAGRAGPGWGRGPGGGGGGWSTDGGQELDLEELLSGMGGSFEQLFGGGGRRRGPRPARKGRDIRYPQAIQISFQTSILGGETQVAVSRPDGSLERLQVRIPPGIQDGKQVRLRGKGEPGGGGGNAGDLLVPIQVAPHHCFRRRGDNLEVDVHLSVAEAALGTKIDLPTPKGTISLTIPPGKSSGDRLRVKGFGVEGPRGKGDLFAVVQIKVPQALDDKSQQLLREFTERNPQPLRSDLQW